MIRKLEILGMALVAVLALVAVMASTASAASYTAASYPASGTATSAAGNETFEFDTGKVECAGHFAGTLSAASSSLTVAATFTSCRGFSVLSATVNMNGCDFLFTTPAGSSDNWSANVDVVCPSGKVIEITAGTCKVTIGSQGPLSKVNLTNDTAAGDLTVKAAAGGLAYIVTQDGFACAFHGTGARAGGSYIQDAAVTFDSPVNIDVG